MANEVVGGIVGKVELDDGNLDVQLAKLKTSLGAVEGQLRQAGAGGAASARQFGELAARKADLRVQIDQVTNSMKAQAAATRQLAVGMGGVGASGMSTGQKLMIMGQVVDDAQYGMVALTNQAGQVAMALGLGAGVGGAAMAAMVAVSQLLKNWHGFTTLIGMGAVETAAEEMERLGAKTKRTADEQARLNALKREEKTWIDVGEGRSPAEKATESAMMEALAGAPGRDVLKGLTEVNRDVVKMTPKDREDIEAARERDAILKAADAGRTAVQPLHQLFRAVHGTEAEVKERINKRLADENLQVSKDLIDNAIHGIGQVGENARRQLQRIAAEAPGAFPVGLAAALKAASPEGQEAARVQREQSAGRVAERAAEKARELKLGGGTEKEREIAQRANEAEGRRYERAYQEKLGGGSEMERETKQRANEAAGNRNARAFDRRKREEFKAGGDPRERALAADRRSQNEAEERRVLDRLPGLGTAAEREYIKLLGRSGGDTAASREKLEGQIREKLEAGGMGILPAMERAREMASSTARGVDEEIATRALNGPPVRNSAVMDTSQLNASVQASVTNEDTALKVQEKMLTELGQIKAMFDRFNPGQPVKAGGR